MTLDEQLFAAVQAVDATAVLAALAAGAKADAQRTYEVGGEREMETGSETALQLAVTSGDVGIVELLLSRGADVNARDAANGRTALVEAARRGHVGVVQALLAAGASPTLADARAGDDALCAAIAAHQVEVARLLLAAGAPVSARALEHACHGGRLDLAAMCVNGSLTPANTPVLVAAARAGHGAMVDWLLVHGASIASEGAEALLEATNQGHANVVDLLLQHGVAVDGANAYGWTAVHFAAYGGHTTILERLLAHGADAERVDAQQRAPLSWAEEAGQAECAARLRAASGPRSA